jgi:hypothetical protein
MVESILYNPSDTIDLSFVRQVNILDTALVNINGSVKEGSIKLISIRGININLGCGDRFYKWCHVVAVKKK